MFIVNNEITITWLLKPTATPLLETDFDIKFVTSGLDVTYTDAAIVNYVAPAVGFAGNLQYLFTPTNQGHLEVYLTTGSGATYTILDKKDFYVFCAPPTTQPVIEVLGPNPIIPPACLASNLTLVETMASASEAQIDSYGAASEITDTHIAVGWLFSVDIFDQLGAFIRTTTNNDFGIPQVVALNSTQVLITNDNYNDGNLNAGRAFVYNLSTGALEHTLINPNSFGTTTNDFFGNSAAMSEDFIIVAAVSEDNVSFTAVGAVYIFSASTGALTQTLVDPAPGPNQEFGSSVSISASYAVVGKRNGGNQGIAFIYSPTTGALLRTIANPDLTPPSLMSFGYAVAVTETHLLISAPGQDPTQSGVVYVYDPSDGTLLHTLTNPNVHGSADFDRFGEGQNSPQGVALSSKYAMVNAHKEEGPLGETLSGAAYIFDLATGSLLFTLINPNDFGTPQGDSFSRSLGITDNGVIVGAPSEDSTGPLLSTGRAYRYTFT